MNWDTTTPMKRFLVFAHGDFSASGGMADCIGSFDTHKQAKEEAAKRKEPYVEIFDCEKRVLC